MGRAGASLLAIAGIAMARDARAVEGGVIDRGTTHAVAIATGGPQGPTYLCSGTLIAPNVVLTARHCIAEVPLPILSCSQQFSDPPGAPRDLWVTALPWTQPSSDWINVASWVTPTTRELCGDDVALLVLADAFTAAQATPARPVLEEAELRAALHERVVGISGFGAASVNGEGAGARRSRFDIAVRCVPGDVAFACGGVLETVGFDEFTSGAGPCRGDSGAGALARGDHAAVLGVLARRGSTGDSCASGVFVRTDAWSWLIAKTVREAAVPPDSAPSWAIAAFPEHPAVGERCRAHECDPSAECVSLDNHRSFVCAKRCSSSGCGDGLHCESNVCVAGAPAEVGGGCAIRGVRRGFGGAAGLSGIVAVELALGARRLRRRRPRDGDAGRRGR